MNKNTTSNCIACTVNFELVTAKWERLRPPLAIFFYLVCITSATE